VVSGPDLYRALVTGTGRNAGIVASSPIGEGDAQAGRERVAAVFAADIAAGTITVTVVRERPVAATQTHRRQRREGPGVMATAVEPVRVWRRRVPGWRMPAGTRYVGRGSHWGNPHPVNEACEACGGVLHSPVQAVVLFREHLAQHPELLARVGELAGQNLACWCKPTQPCHADVLIDLANRGRGENLALPRGTSQRGGAGRQLVLELGPLKPPGWDPVCGALMSKTDTEAVAVIALQLRQMNLGHGTGCAIVTSWAAMSEQAQRQACTCRWYDASVALARGVLKALVRWLEGDRDCQPTDGQDADLAVGGGRGRHA
jgi:hypothetical protein